MSKWKCDICGKEFDNFHAQGFDNKVYCPLCFFKEENRRLKEKINTYENPEDMTLMYMWCDEKAKDKIKQLKEVIEEVRKSLEDYQEYIDEAKEFYSDLEDDDVVKVSNLQILNNQMVRNYDLLQILDKGVKND